MCHVTSHRSWTPTTSQCGGGSPESRCGRRLDVPRAPADSPCSRVSSGGSRRSRGHRNRCRQRAERRPELRRNRVAARGHVGRSWCWLRAPGDALSAMVCSASSFNGSSHGGDKAQWRRASAMVENGARAWEREGEKRGSEQGLTASPMSARARSGTPGSSRIDGQDPWWPAMETAILATLWCVHHSMARWRG